MVRGAPCWSQHSPASPQEGGGVLGQPSGSQFANATSIRAFKRHSPYFDHQLSVEPWSKEEVPLFSNFLGIFSSWRVSVPGFDLGTLLRAHRLFKQM